MNPYDVIFNKYRVYFKIGQLCGVHLSHSVVDEMGTKKQYFDVSSNANGSGKWSGNGATVDEAITKLNEVADHALNGEITRVQDQFQQAAVRLQELKSALFGF
jgi:hypothetical protein